MRTIWIVGLVLGLVGCSADAEDPPLGSEAAPSVTAPAPCAPSDAIAPPAPEPLPACEDDGVPMLASDGVERCRPAAAINMNNGYWGTSDCQGPLIAVPQSQLAVLGYFVNDAKRTMVMPVVTQFEGGIWWRRDDGAAGYWCESAGETKDYPHLAFYVPGEDIASTYPAARR